VRFDMTVPALSKVLQCVVALALMLVASDAPGQAQSAGPARPATPVTGIRSDILIGAIRWDAWFDGGRDVALLRPDRFGDRIPFYARPGATPGDPLIVDGTTEHVMNAELAYARAMGVDYFLFGFYPEDGSWNRDRATHQALNRSLQTYLRMPDTYGVRFAVSLNQTFPRSDADEYIERLSSFVSRPNYVRAQDRTVPVFLFDSGRGSWSRTYGGSDAGRDLLNTLRRGVEASTGQRIVFVLLHPNPVVGQTEAANLGVPIVSTYSNFAPSDGGAVPFARCAAHGRSVWERAARAGVTYLPNVTLGWDTRPRAAPDETPVRRRTWCLPPDRATLASAFADAAHFVGTQEQAAFKSVLVYAWNEFTEGGWMVPTWANGAVGVAILRDAIGRRPTLPPIELTWPTHVRLDTCPVRTGGLTRETATSRCTSDTGPAVADWPCPPGSRVGEDRLRAPTGLEFRVWSGAWMTRQCLPSP
jgi:hypothetical protein